MPWHLGEYYLLGRFTDAVVLRPILRWWDRKNEKPGLFNESFQGRSELVGLAVKSPGMKRILHCCWTDYEAATIVEEPNTPMMLLCAIYLYIVMFSAAAPRQSAVAVQHFACSNECKTILSVESVERKTAGQRSQMELENSCWMAVTAADSQKENPPSFPSNFCEICLPPVPSLE